MNTYEIRGTVARILDPQTFSSGFTKREFILQTDEKYPQSIKLECVKERMAQLDPVREGATVNVSFRIRGSEYNGKFFVNLQALGISVEGAGEEGPDTEDAARIPREPEPEAEPEKEMPF